MARRLNYRILKKRLNQYHKFSFKMPRKGKDFSPQQKAAITRVYNKLHEKMRDVLNDRQSFIPYPKGSKLPLIDGVRTNKGIFYKYPGAQLKVLKKTKKRKKYTVKTVFRSIKEVFIPFEDYSVMNNIDDIRKFVDEKALKFKPDYIMWSVYGYKGMTRYDPDVFELYMVELELNPEFSQDLEDKPFINGVFFGYFPPNY